MSGPAIACRYCRTGSALRYLQTKAAADEARAERKKRRNAGEVIEGPEPKPEFHDEGCTERADHGNEVTLYCQACGQERTGDRLRAWLAGWRLRCPTCGVITEHHAAPLEVVEAGECLCGACAMDRMFKENAAAAASAARRAA